MKTNSIKLIFLICSCFLLGCQSSDCDSEFYAQVSGLEMLKEAKMIQCEDNLEWYTLALFQLDKSQVRELLESGDFEPVRSSLEMVDFPLFWVNRIFQEVDELSTHSFEYSEKISCNLALKESDNLLAVFISYPDRSGD